jgi:hypothetical protein
MTSRFRKHRPPHPVLACRTRVFPSPANYDWPKPETSDLGGEDRPLPTHWAKVEFALLLRISIFSE